MASMKASTSAAPVMATLEMIQVQRLAWVILVSWESSFNAFQPVSKKSGRVLS